MTTAGQINTEGAQYLSDFLDSFDAEGLPEAEKQKLAGTLKCFAADGAGNPFFMNFSQSSEQPAVVYWDDGILALRTVAASPKDFFTLFVPED